MATLGESTSMLATRLIMGSQRKADGWVISSSGVIYKTRKQAAEAAQRLDRINPILNPRTVSKHYA
jgi:hypothetical protein